MLELVAKGGPLMVPILLGSVVALAIFLERLVALRRSRVAPPELTLRVRELLLEGRVGEAGRVLEADPSVLARVLSAAVAQAGRPREVVKERVEEVGRRESAHLERYVGMVGVVAAVEPLLGLLGTVTGMIGVFRRVVSEGVGDPRLLAGGIWEALVTTAAGLTVAIPAYLAWRWLVAGVRDRVLEMEAGAAEVVDLVSREPAAEAEAP